MMLMVLESDSYVKDDPKINVKKMDDLSKHGDRGILKIPLTCVGSGTEEDLEDGEILDDEEEQAGSVTAPAPASAPTAVALPEVTRQRKSSQEVAASAPSEKVSPPPATEKGSVRRERGDENRGRHHRNKSDEARQERHSKRHGRHHSKRHREGHEPGAPREKRSRVVEERRDEAGSQSEEDDDMMFVRGASPSSGRQHPEGHYQGQGYSDEEGPPFDYESYESDPEEHNMPQYRMDSDRGNKQNRRGMGNMRGNRGGMNANKKGVRPKEKLRGKRGMMDNKKRDQCVYYMQGKCHRGDDCPFLHSGTPPRKMELCKFYMMDCCAKKDKCLYMHKDFPCKFYHSGLKCFAGSDCKFNHEQLNAESRQILLKHIETAPKEILGDFPRLPRDNNGEVILPTYEEVLRINSHSRKSSKRDRGIPSLFDIHIKPSVEQLRNLNNEDDSPERSDEEEEYDEDGRGQANVRPGSFYQERHEESEEESIDDDDFQAQLRKRMKEQRRQKERERDEQQEVDRQRPVEPENIMESKMDVDHRIRPSYDPSANNESATSQVPVPPQPQVQPQTQQPSVLPSLLRFYQDTLESKEEAAAADAAEQTRRLQLLVSKAVGGASSAISNRGGALGGSIDSDDEENQLVMATQDEEDEETEDSQQQTSKQDSDSAEEDGLRVPKGIPKKQRELFLRIQQQQEQRKAAAAAAAAAEEESKSKSSPAIKQKEEEEDNDDEDTEERGQKDENWYSSDEDAEDRSLTNILKNLPKQNVAPSPDFQASTNNAAPVTKSAGLNTTGTATGVLESLNLANINISPDLSKLLSTISTIRSNTVTQSESPSSTSASTSANRDPRASRDPRFKGEAAEVHAAPKPTLASSADVDLRMLPMASKGDMDLRQTPSVPASSIGDTDLRAGCFGDTDLRNVSLLGLPFKPVPAHVPCQEIDGSIGSHPPVQYKLLPAHVISPDYSKLKLNFSDPAVRADPRLKKLVAHMDITSQSPMSPPPCEVPKAADPRRAGDPRSDPRAAAAAGSDPRSVDPRMATRLSAPVLNQTSTPVIPVTSMLPQIPVGMPIMAPGLGLLRTPDTSVMPPAPGVIPPHMMPQMMNRADGLLGPVPMHMAMNPMMMMQPGMIPPMQQNPEEDYDGPKHFDDFRGRRGRGNWERRGRGRGGRGRPGMWDRGRRGGHRDFDRSPPRHDRNKDRFNSPGRDGDPRRRHSPSYDSRNRGRDYSPQRPRSTTPPYREDGAGSFTPPGGSFDSPRDDEGSFTPPRN